MNDQTEFGKIEHIIKSFISRANEELEERWSKWQIDLSKSEFHEVVGALLARQVTLACELAQCPQIWNGHIAPLILRAMADCYINLAWVFKDPIERSRKFILYGLGQEKLMTEHRKAQIQDKEPDPVQQMMIDASEKWVNSQRFTFLTDVNLGSWSGTSTREMAEKAGCIDFYNYVYIPFSACSHSMWHHIARYNLRECLNPLHQYHKVPYDPKFDIDSEYLYLAAKYLQKSFSTFDKNVGMDIEGISAYKELLKNLDELSDMQKESEDTSAN